LGVANGEKKRRIRNTELVGIRSVADMLGHV